MKCPYNPVSEPIREVLESDESDVIPSERMKTLDLCDV
jgi:hypothetical protein